MTPRVGSCCRWSSRPTWPRGYPHAPRSARGGGDERVLAAVHESAHAVVGVLVGYCVLSASVQWADETLRRGVRAETRLGGRWREQPPWASLAVDLAGPLAEARYAQQDLLAVLNKGAEDEGSDLRQAQREAARLASEGLYQSADHALLVAEGHARRLLVMHWDFVLRAARRLVVQGRID